ncbi:Tubulin-specific chaperone A [Sciurus carolinensis]|uniref:Tubulin-specific chaperone A n=1 Tax=Sciurus carolinensis TaxID=30640 RepID=A0AA41MBM6_SCICA|nr:Tubulin-specific chaperone A [Sciurus carolinensis]
MKKRKNYKKRFKWMKVEGGESYAIVKHAEFLLEPQMMTPDCQHSLEAAYTNLQKMLERGKDLKEAEEYKETHSLLYSVALEA